MASEIKRMVSESPEPNVLQIPTGGGNLSIELTIHYHLFQPITLERVTKGRGQRKASYHRHRKDLQSN